MNYVVKPDALLPKIIMKGYIIQIIPSIAINTDQINWVIVKLQVYFELQRHTLEPLCCIF